VRCIKHCVLPAGGGHLVAAKKPLCWLSGTVLAAFLHPVAATGGSFPKNHCAGSQAVLAVLSAVLQIGWICQTVIVFGVPYDPETYFAPSGVGRTFFWIFALLPWCPLSKGTQDLAAATNSDKSPGMWAMHPPRCVDGLWPCCCQCSNTHAEFRQDH
jgi:hypothetical protein